MNIRHLVATAAAVAFLAGPAFAQSAVQRNESAAGVNATANAPLPVLPMGTIYGINAPVSSTAVTSEQTMASFALPAGTLDVPGRRLRITATLLHAANTNSVVPKLYFGSEALATAADSTSASAMVLQGLVLKTGASTQDVSIWGLGGAAGVVPVTYSAAGAETDTAAITIKVTCTNSTGSAGDCVLEDFNVEILN